MKKLFTIIVLSLCLVVSSSCTTEEIKEPPKYTAKEQLDYINDNLYFKDESIKLGKPLVNYDQVEDPGRLETTELNDNSITKVYRRGINKSNGEYSYRTFTDFQSDGLYDHYDYAFEIVMNDRFDNVVGETDIVKGLFSRIDNFEFFGERYKGDLTVIDTKLKERGFYGSKGSYSYGFIKINVSTIDFYGKTVICDISLYIGNYISLYKNYNHSQELLDKIYTNKEDLLKYFVPVNVVDDCVFIITIGINPTKDSKELSSLNYINKNDLSNSGFYQFMIEHIKNLEDSNVRPEDKFYSKIQVKYLNLYYIDGIKVVDNKYFIENIQEFNFDILESNTFNWENDYKFDTSNFTDNYKYLADLIINEEGYEEYRSAYPLE